MPEIRNKRILLTGVAGFIASNLAEALLNEGAEVIGLDNFETGRKDNLKDVEEHPSFSFIEADIRDHQACLNACEGVDIVIHQAALGSVPRSIADPLNTHAVNNTGFLNILEAARQSGIKRFVYAASSSTYGDAKELPKVEEKIGNALSPYAVTKHVNEQYARVYNRLYGMECIGLRYFNVFGPKQDPDGAYAAAIPKFIKSMLNGVPPTIHGDGSQSRDFTYIENVVQINLKAAATDNMEAYGEVFNVAYGECNDLNQLFDLLKEELSAFEPQIATMMADHGPERQGDVKHSLADISKAKRMLGYDPQYDLKRGMKQAIAWYVNELAAT